MSLRLRLVLVLIGLSVPLVALLTWARASLDDQAEVDALHQFINGRMVEGRAQCEADPENFPHPPRHLPPRDGSPGGRRGPGGEFREQRPPGPRTPGGPGPREREARPRGERPFREDRPPLDELLPEPGPRIDLFAYGPDFVSENRRAPRFPPTLRAQLEAGEEVADEKFGSPRGQVVRVAARMPWGEGPCAIVLAIRPGFEPGWFARHQWTSALALVFGLSAVVFLAAGPIAARVRRLTAEVQRSAADRYAEPATVTGRDEITQLARAFNEAREQLRDQFETVEDRERALREFVGNTTHDVMIPMTVLQGHLAALRDASGRPDPALLHDAMEEVQYMTSLLQNLGATAKLEVGERSLERTEVDLGALVGRVASRHAPLARQKGLGLEFSVPDDPVRTAADLTLLEQAVSNLVHNAVRYGHADGHVAILLDERHGRFRLRVVDDGPGIEPAQLERLQRRAYRGGEARTRYPEGQGLGLHIALEVARRHGLELVLQASEYGGLEARLEGPLHEQGHPPEGRIS